MNRVTYCFMQNHMANLFYLINKSQKKTQAIADLGSIINSGALYINVSIFYFGYLFFIGSISYVGYLFLIGSINGYGSLQ